VHTQSTAHYNLADTAEPLTISFAPLTTPMVAHFVLWTDDDHWTEAIPVLGIVVQHDVNVHGEVTAARTEMAIQLEDTAELCTVREYERYCGSCTLVAVLPAGTTPTDQENEHRVAFGRRTEQMLAANRQRREAAA
jgi:hypothetical protein